MNLVQRHNHCLHARFRAVELFCNREQKAARAKEGLQGRQQEAVEARQRQRQAAFEPPKVPHICL